MKTVVILILFLPNILIAQLPKFGVKRNVMSNGLVHNIYSIDEEIIYEDYIDSTHCMVESNYGYINKKLNGVLISNYENGQVESIKSFVYGIEAGVWLFFSKNGQLIEYMSFDFNQKDIFLSTPISFKHAIPIVLGNKIDGFDTVSYDTAFEREYYKLPTTHRFYYPNGKLRYERHFNENKKDGVWLYYNEFGKLIKKEKYLMGDLKEVNQF